MSRNNEDNIPTTTFPSLYDVVCSRVDGFASSSSTQQQRRRKYPGNQLFDALIRENKAQFDLSQNDEQKRLLVFSLVQAIHQHGGRFLRMRNRQWMEIPEEQVVIQTWQALGGTRSRSRKPLIPSILTALTTSSPQKRGRKPSNLGMIRGKGQESSSSAEEKENMGPGLPEYFDCITTTQSSENLMMINNINDMDDALYFLPEITPDGPEGVSTKILREISMENIPTSISIDHDDDDDDDTVELGHDWKDLSPLDPYDTQFTQSAEFSGLCCDLLELWG